MKKFICLVASTAFIAHAALAQKTIEIKNPLDKDRLELISIPFDQFKKHFNVDTIFTIKDKSSTKVYAHQLEKLGNAAPQNVLIEIPIESNAVLNLIVSTDKSPATASKTYARYVPERFDDFAWENNVVAFRLYGKALEGRKDDAQGMDYWAKRTENLIINKWYKGDDYHKDHGEGLDYYSVGQTLGAGDLALYFNNKIHFTKHYRTFNVLDNGPLRTTFKLDFESEELAGETIQLSKTISIDANQHFNNITIQLNNKNKKNTPVVVGLVKRGESNPSFEFDKDDNYLAYWEPEINNSGKTGTALIFTKEKPSFINNDEKQFLLKTTIKNNKPFIYYNGAAWDRAGKITSFDQWDDYVEDFSEKLKKPLKVKLK